ncbi:MAG: hypothetical protein M0014_04795 [Actinomycetota bacterium]|jgi:hypothetical protein|nr:hypothetical protein [Actinomycetota bacterium]
MECVENGADLIAAAIKSGEKLIVVDDSPTEMVYLSGCTAPRYQDALIDLGVGLLIQPNSYAPHKTAPFVRWAADNGCFPPDDHWSPTKWLRMLGEIDALDEETKTRCLFVLVPDMPFDHAETCHRWERWSPVAYAFGLPLAFAIQDGATLRNVPWGEFDVAFLAGTTEWKMSEEAYSLAAAARDRGKWVHMGRVNSWKRLDWASTIGCDSSDGTFTRFGKPEEMVSRIAAWLANDQGRLTQRHAATSSGRALEILAEDAMNFDRELFPLLPRVARPPSLIAGASSSALGR